MPRQSQQWKVERVLVENNFGITSVPQVKEIKVFQSIFTTDDSILNAFKLSDQGCIFFIWQTYFYILKDCNFRSAQYRYQMLDLGESDTKPGSTALDRKQSIPATRIDAFDTARDLSKLCLLSLCSFDHYQRQRLACFASKFFIQLSVRTVRESCDFTSSFGPFVN